MRELLFKFIRTENIKLAFWTVLFTAIFAWTLWVTLNQMGDMPPLVAKSWTDIGG